MTDRKRPSIVENKQDDMTYPSADGNCNEGFHNGWNFGCLVSFKRQSGYQSGKRGAIGVREDVYTVMTS